MTKCIGALLVLAIARPGFAESAGAGQTQTFVQRQIISHPDFVNALALTLVGAAQGNTYRKPGVGAFVGLCAAVIDQALIHLGASSHHYLSYGLLGASTLSTLPLPYHLGEAVGVGVGIMVPAGILPAEKLQAPLMGAVTGFHCGGKEYGTLLAGVGFLGGVFDEAIASVGLSQARLLTTLFESLALSRIFLPRFHSLATKVPRLGPSYQRIAGSSQIPASAIGVPVFALILYMRGTSPQKWSAMELNDGISNTTAAVIGKEHFEDIHEYQFLLVLETRMLTLQLGNKIADVQQVFFGMFESLNVLTDEKWERFTDATYRFVLYVFPYFINKFSSSYITAAFEQTLAQDFENGLRSKYLREEMPLKLSQNNETDALLDHMNKHISELTTVGFSLISSGVDRAAEGIYGIGFLGSKHSLDLGVFLLIYNKGTEWVTLFLNQKAQSNSETLNKQLTQITDLEKEFRKNAEVIAQNDNLPLLAAKLNRAVLARTLLQHDAEFWNLVSSGWFDSLGFLNFLVTNFMIASKIKAGDLDFGFRNLIAMRTHSASKLMSWEAENAAQILRVRKALKSLDELIAAMEAKNEACHKSQTVYRQSSPLSISFENFEVGLTDRTLVQIPQLTLEKGVYVLTGKSGSGKSSFLSKIKGIVNNGVCSKGTLTFSNPSGAAPKIVAASQSDYLVPGASALELLVDRDLTNASHEEKSELIEKSSALLTEIEIDSIEAEGQGILSKLDEAKNWESILSGGQKKKLVIIRTILKRPDIAILDEVFNGLDQHSIRVAQRMLKEYLPDTLFIFVDHHAHEHNFEGFFDYELHLGQGGGLEETALVPPTNPLGEDQNL
ncbi:MAG: ATP-binding cassette domain-containing protein [Deltaproteobacteria bacterium]|nr:ATP-binding cassette domain-containing protein [Deltaproteobacteria bacterium]